MKKDSVDCISFVGLPSSVFDYLLSLNKACLNFSNHPFPLIVFSCLCQNNFHYYPGKECRFSNVFFQIEELWKKRETGSSCQIILNYKMSILAIPISFVVRLKRF